MQIKHVDPSAVVTSWEIKEEKNETRLISSLYVYIF